jgi:hypothetical protein
MSKARSLVDNYAGDKPVAIDAKGDILVGNSADSVVRVPVGTNNTVLTADSATTSGVKWVESESGFNPFLLMGV